MTAKTSARSSSTGSVVRARRAARRSSQTAKSSALPAPIAVPAITSKGKWAPNMTRVKATAAM